MAGGVGKGKGNNLNLVPFVDLFSTLIIFLITTAVWDELAAVKMNMGVQDKPAKTVVKNKEDVKKIKSDLKVTIREDMYEIFDQGHTSRFPKNGDQWDFTPLEQFFAEARGKYPDKKDMVIMSGDKVAYEDLIAVMDRSLAQDFRELIVTGLEQ